VSFRLVEVNGDAGALYLDDQERVISVMALDIADGEIRGINGVVNPDKLRHLGPVADIKALLRSAK
jgi:RNA polymerase sigma-70 factor (ECF subfamily)